MVLRGDSQEAAAEEVVFLVGDVVVVVATHMVIVCVCVCFIVEGRRIELKGGLVNM